MSDEGPLEVPCATNPDVLTALRCGSCETPICPRCLVMTPVGARCRSCARLKSHPVYDVRPLHYLRGAAAGLAVATIGSIVVSSVPFIGYLGLLILGWATGEAVTYAANRKRGPWLAAIAAVALLLGTLGIPAILYATTLPPVVSLDARLLAAGALMLRELMSLWGLFLGLAVLIAMSRVR